MVFSLNVTSQFSSVQFNSFHFQALIDILQTKVQILNLEYFLTHSDEEGKEKETSKLNNPSYKVFEDHLSGLNDDWHKLLTKAKHSCLENEQVCIEGQFT